jgi:fluoride exporter
MTLNFQALFPLMLGGAIGTLLRFIIYQIADRHLNQSYPWGTFIVNLLGSLLIGLLWSYFDKSSISPAMRVFLFIGILGSFTTFSTFAFDNLSLAQEGAFRVMAINILLTNVLGIGLCFVGYYLVKIFS